VGNMHVVSRIITQPYVAPEWLGDVSSLNLYQCDVYSMGLVILETCGVSSSKFRALQDVSTRKTPLKEILMMIEEKYQQKWLVLMLESMLEYEPKKRMNFSKIKTSILATIPVTVVEARATAKLFTLTSLTLLFLGKQDEIVEEIAKNLPKKKISLTSRFLCCIFIFFIIALIFEPTTESGKGKRIHVVEDVLFQKCKQHDIFLILTHLRDIHGISLPKITEVIFQSIEKEYRKTPLRGKEDIKCFIAFLLTIVISIKVFITCKSWSIKKKKNTCGDQMSHLETARIYCTVYDSIYL